MDYSEPLTPAGLDVPTLVLHNRDSIDPLELVRAVAEDIPGSSFVQVDGADTYPLAGDIDVRGEDVSGIAVNVAARIMGQAEAGETLVSASVRESALGSGLHFGEVGPVELKGIPDQFTLHRWLP